MNTERSEEEGRREEEMKGGGGMEGRGVEDERTSGQEKKGARRDEKRRRIFVCVFQKLQKNTFEMTKRNAMGEKTWWTDGGVQEKRKRIKENWWQTYRQR